MSLLQSVTLTTVMLFYFMSCWFERFKKTEFWWCSSEQQKRRCNSCSSCGVCIHCWNALLLPNTFFGKSKHSAPAKGFSNKPLLAQLSVYMRVLHLMNEKDLFMENFKLFANQNSSYFSMLLISWYCTHDRFTDKNTF